MDAESPEPADATPDKEPIVYRGGWGFQRRWRHRVKLEDGGLVTLATATSSGTYELLVGTPEETDEELHILVGAWVVGDKYPFPTLESEVSRLRKALGLAGVPLGETARMEVETDDSYTTRLRGQLSSARRPG